MWDPIKKKEVGDTIEISILELLRTIAKIIGRNINILDTKRTQKSNIILYYNIRKT